MEQIREAHDRKGDTTAVAAPTEKVEKEGEEEGTEAPALGAA